MQVALSYTFIVLRIGDEMSVYVRSPSPVRNMGNKVLEVEFRKKVSMR